MATMDMGSALPELFLLDQHGGRFSLQRYLGAPLVVYFYPKDDTPGCTREAQDFSTHLAEFAALGAAVLGVSKDPPAKHAKFAAKYGLGVALASDDDANLVLDAFGVWGEKRLYGRTYMGIERATFLFNSAGRLARAWRKVKVPGHVAEVLAAAAALG